MTSPVDIALEWNRNPLRREVKLEKVDREFNLRFLAEFKQKLDLREAATKPSVTFVHRRTSLTITNSLLQDKVPVGWLTWPKTTERSLASAPGKSALKRWEKASEDMIAAVREVALSNDYWKS